jgi:hypothetical protein
VAVHGVIRALIVAGSAVGLALASSGPSPRFEIEAPPELVTEARRVEAVAASDHSAALRMTGVDGFARTIRIVLAPEDSQLARSTPGWVSGFADGQAWTIVVFPARVPSYPDRTLEALVRHEVAHVLVDAAAGGRAVPRWFHEGVATVAAREWGVEDGARYAMAVVGRRERTTEDLDEGFAAGGRRAARAYALSAAFVRMLESDHGPDITARVLEGVRRGVSFRVAFREATGVPLARAERRFFRDRAFWHTWVPFLTSSVALWMAITLLSLWAFARRRARSADMHARWDAEDVLPGAHPPDETVH